MARNFAWRHQNRIKADITNRFVRVCCEPNLCGGCDPPTLPLANRFRSLIEVGPRFHLGEDQELAPACDDIDFAERAPPASRQNAESLCDQEDRGAAFCRDANSKRCLPFRPRRLYGPRRM